MNQGPAAEQQLQTVPHRGAMWVIALAVFVTGLACIAQWRQQTAQSAHSLSLAARSLETAIQDEFEVGETYLELLAQSKMGQSLKFDAPTTEAAFNLIRERDYFLAISVFDHKLKIVDQFSKRPIDRSPNQTLSDTESVHAANLAIATDAPVYSNVFDIKQINTKNDAMGLTISVIDVFVPMHDKNGLPSLIALTYEVQNLVTNVQERLSHMDIGATLMTGEHSHPNTENGLYTHANISLPGTTLHVVVHGEKPGLQILSLPGMSFLLAITALLTLFARRHQAINNNRQLVKEIRQKSIAHYQKIFTNVEIPLFEVDISGLFLEANNLRAKGIRDYKAHLTETPDEIERLTGLIVITDANKAAIKLYDAEAMRDLTNPETASKILTDEYTEFMVELIGAISNGEGTLQTETKLRTLKGNLIDVLISIPIPASLEQARTVPYSMTNITEKAERELTLIKAMKKADDANRAKSQFLASMSHEIRTPMNGILGMAQLLISSSISHKEKEYAQIIHDSGQDLLSLLNDILDLSKVEAEKLELVETDFSITELITSTERFWRSEMGRKGLDFTVEQKTTLPECFIGDPQRIRQILFNMIGNACKFTENGEIRVSLSHEMQSSDSALLNVSVTDTGIGIADADRPRIFEKFGQADASNTRKYGGTGLGLAISKGLVETMGGNIDFVSELGKGATFTFSIPCKITLSDASTGSEISDSEEAQLADQIAKLRLRILLADDNQTNIVVVKSLLERAQVTFDVVSNGFDAVEAIKRTRYDAVLMDIRMPQLDGMAATKIVRNLPDPHAQTPIVAVTANAMVGDRETYINAGMSGYVTKPIEIGDLYRTLLDVCGKHECKDAGLQRA